ncbi:phage portal protein [Anaeroselena agilis]|uniref:Phage portal protein n=1 Tax=Anaeroselena agilis TaxID=3063788 RepID=A0ABU3NV03_9FIRM|nr:phage portal protein [Selenomonadales bacterium 4137-cl]
MEFRNMFNAVFGDKKPPVNVTQYQFLNDYAPFFSSVSGNFYDNDVVRTCIDAIARNAAKLKPKHIRRANGRIATVADDLQWLLEVRPNPYMSAYDFLYKVVSQLYTNNNSFIYIHLDTLGKITGLFPLSYSSIEFVEYQGELYCRFYFLGGFKMTVPYTELIHLRRHFNGDDIFGESNQKPFKPTLSLIQTVNEGIINAIKSSARLRGFLKFTQTLRPEDLKAQRDKFVADYLSVNNDGGIGAVDAKADFTPVEMNSKMVDDKQMAVIRDNAYRYFGVSENIIKADYTEDQWNAFYESVLEPIAIQLSLEFTEKCFSDREKGFGNEIVFEANRLQYASNQTKINLLQYLMPMGIFSVNDALEILNMPPVEDGDRRIFSLNYVNAKLADAYQTGAPATDQNLNTGSGANGGKTTEGNPPGGNAGASAR